LLVLEGLGRRDEAQVFQAEAGIDKEEYETWKKVRVLPKNIGEKEGT
jgi:hypothetical protein